MQKLNIILREVMFMKKIINLMILFWIGCIMFQFLYTKPQRVLIVRSINGI